jgi:long-chain acyl-CoA synthetase
LRAMSSRRRFRQLAVPLTGSAHYHFLGMNHSWLALYPPGVPAEVDISATPTLVHLVDEAAARHGPLSQAVFLGRSFTYERVDRAGRQFASWLASRGIGPGARVAIMMPNVPQYAAAVFGVLRSGATVVNVNPLFTARELAAQLADAGVAAIVVLENFAATLAQAMKGLPPMRVAVAAVGDWLGPVKGPVANFFLRHVKKAVRPWAIDGAVRFDHALAQGAALAFHPPAIRPEDVALLQYTGGTTGVSKGAMLTHANVVTAVLASEAWLAPAVAGASRIDNPTVVCALPLYHVYALVACLLLGLRLGARNLLIANPRNLDAVVRDLRRHPPHLFPAVNTLYNALLDHPGFGRIDFSRLRVANSGGMAVQRAVAERWLARTGCPIIEGWGLTEATAGVTCNRVDARDWSGTVGIPFPGCEIGVRDAMGEPVTAGEPGEVVVRGAQVMAGYWRRPEETARAFTEDGWLRTGDIGVMDANGELRIVDRMKDMIIVSGFNVYPNEIEDVVAMMPGVLEVCATAAPDERSGEVVRLVVVRKDPALTRESVLEHCRKHLTGYKLPRIIEFWKELPKSNVGKVLRREVRNAPAREA